MDFSRLSDLPIIDGHIHFPRPELLDDILEVMAIAGVTRANLVAVPDLELINQNPALIYNFGHNLEAARDFFFQDQDRLIYGTDTGASAIGGDASEGLDRAESLGRAWVVPRFLETDETFAAPEGTGHWLGMDVAKFRGIGLPRDVLKRVCRGNFERLFGARPAPLDRQVAIEALERQARAIDALNGGGRVESPARQVAREPARLC